MQVDELSVTRGELPDDSVDSIQIGASNARIDGQKVAGIVTEGRVVNRTEQNWPYGKRVQERVQLLLEARNTLAPICSKPGEEIVTPYRYQCDRRSAPHKSPRLSGKIIDPRAIPSPMVELRRHE